MVESPLRTIQSFPTYKRTFVFDEIQIITLKSIIYVGKILDNYILPSFVNTKSKIIGTAKIKTIKVSLNSKDGIKNKVLT